VFLHQISASFFACNGDLKSYLLVLRSCTVLLSSVLFRANGLWEVCETPSNHVYWLFTTCNTYIFFANSVLLLPEQMRAHKPFKGSVYNVCKLHPPNIRKFQTGNKPRTDSKLKQCLWQQTDGVRNIAPGSRQLP